MFKHIMLPVDRHLPPEVRKAADVAAQVAKWQGAKITLVSVTGAHMGESSETEAEIDKELAEFTAAHGRLFSTLGAHDDLVVIALFIRMADACLRALHLALANFAKVFSFANVVQFTLRALMQCHSYSPCL